MTGRLLGWLVGPIGKWVLVGAILAAWTLGNRIDAARKATAECQLDVLHATIDLERNRARVADRIAAEARARADETRTELETLEAITREITNTSGDACPIPDDIRERLLRIQ